MSTTIRSLRNLVEMMDSGELTLPEIQRDFVWKKKNVLYLFDSLYRGLPIGYMLVWKTKTSVAGRKYKSKYSRSARPSFNNFYGYLLDGQQRLTSIRLVRDGDDNYPLMFGIWPEDEEKPDEDRFSYSAKWNSNNPWYIPVADILNNSINAYDIIKKLEKEVANFDPQTDAKTVYESVAKLENIMDYKIGIIEFEDDNYRNATELFIRFNSTGKKLKLTDLVSAELALSVPDLVSKGINRFCTKYSPTYSFSSSFLIQSLIAVHTGRLNLKNPKEMWVKSENVDIKKSWERTEKGLNRIIEFLSGTMKWDSINWLPSINSIIPLIFLLSDRKFSPEERKQARSWLAKANLFAVFSGSTHTELDRILRGLSREASIDKLSTLTKMTRAKIIPEHFETRRRSGASMSLYISMLRNTNARDWVSKTALDGSVLGHNAELQVHHFFPNALLRRHGYSSELINTFANYTVINKETNINISAEEPSKYIDRLNLSKKDLSDQCIPLDEDLWKVKNYDEFIKQRQQLLAKIANSFVSE